MVRGLKVVLIVFGALSILSGLAHIIAPDQLAAMMGLEEMPAVCSPAMYAMAMVGISYIAGGVFLIVAAGTQCGTQWRVSALLQTVSIFN